MNGPQSSLTSVQAVNADYALIGAYRRTPGVDTAPHGVDLPAHVDLAVNLTVTRWRVNVVPLSEPDPRSLSVGFILPWWVEVVVH